MDAQTEFSIGKSLGLANDANAIPNYIKNIEVFKKQAEKEATEAAKKMQEITQMSINNLDAARAGIFNTLDQIMTRTEKMLSLLLHYREKLSNEEPRIQKMAEQVWDTADKYFQTQMNELQKASPSMEAQTTAMAHKMAMYLNSFSEKITAYAEAFKSSYTGVAELESGYFLGNAIRQAID